MTLKHARLFILFVLIFSSQITTAQQPGGAAIFSIKGKVVDDANGQPLEFATVAVKRMRDSSLVSGTITNTAGEFKIADIGPGGYSVEIAFIGYEKFKGRVAFRPQGSAPVNDMGVIRLKLSAQMLEGAEISADKSFVMNNIDRKTYNTDQLAVTAGGNVSDVLQNVPSVEVDADGTVSLRGNENVTILIDGRPSGMTGAGGKSLLESIPSSAIEKVEVLTNPSAKYDPDGISGIINIVTKKNKLQGFTGSVGASTSFEDRYAANLSLNYRKGRWNVSTNYGFNKDFREFTGKTYRESYFNDVTDILKQDEIGFSNRLNHNFKITTDYNISDRSTISGSALFNIGENDNTNDVNYKLFGSDDIMDSLYIRTTDGSGDGLNMDFDLAFRHNFKQEGRLLNIQTTASFDSDENKNNFRQQGYYDESQPVPVMPILQNDKEIDDNKIYTGSIDYEHPISKDKKFETGIKTTIRDLDTDYESESFNDSAQQFINDINLTNQFVYQDALHAFYAQYRQSINKFGFQLGVRSEYAVTESELITTGEKFDKDYFSVFPSAFVTYKPDDKSQFKVTYSRRINRPRGQQINPFADYDDPLNIRKGNPFLDPEYTDSYEAEYNRFIGKVSLTFTGYARFTHDYIQRYRTFTPDGVTVTTFENLSESRNYGLETILNGSPYKWWSFTFSTNLFKNEIDASNLQDDLNSESFSASGRIFTTFKLPYKLELQLSYFYRAPMKVTQGTMKDMQMATIALSKKVLKDKGVITFRVADPLDIQRFGFEFEDETYKQDFTRRRSQRTFTLGFTYRFGELKDGGRTRNRDTQPREEMDMGF